MQTTTLFFGVIYIIIIDSCTDIPVYSFHSHTDACSKNYCKVSRNWARSTLLGMLYENNVDIDKRINAVMMYCGLKYIHWHLFLYL